MLMTLGPFLFALPTLPYQALTRSSEFRHPAQARVGVRDARQYIGPGADTIELSGILAPELTGGQITLDALRILAGQGREWPLIEGTGRYLGLYVIDGVDETGTLTYADGSPQRIEFTLKLSRTDTIDVVALATSALGTVQAAVGLGA